jgi:endonuclease G, mitochondrial
MLSGATLVLFMFRLQDIEDAEVENVARDRFKRSLPVMQKSLRLIARGKALSSETDVVRRAMRLQAKRVSLGLSLQDFAEKARGNVDYVGINFLELARKRANAVCRIAFNTGANQGTGFLVAPGLMITNHHVISSANLASQLQVQFNFENDAQGQLKQPTSFSLDAARCFVTDDTQGLDFTLVAIGAKRAGSGTLADFGHIPLSDAADKHMLGETANIIQHPNGRPKEIVLRENRIVARDETQVALHYATDTEQGSSGSPVFNDGWEVIALHHFGLPMKEVTGKSGTMLSKEVNEGIRISAIVKHLRGRAAVDDAPQMLKEAVNLWDQGAESMQPMAFMPEEISPEFSAQAREGLTGVRQNPDGSVTLTCSIEVTCRALPH